MSTSSHQQYRRGWIFLSELSACAGAAAEPPSAFARQVSELWDSSIENTVRKLAYGTIAGSLAGLILFRALPHPPLLPPAARCGS